MKMLVANQRLALEYGRIDRDKRRAGHKVFKRARKMSGMSRRDFARALQDHDEEAVGFMRAAASKHDEWIQYFTPAGFVSSGDGERDWESFFEALIECLEKFLPLILAL